ncbi:hypothetical protein M0P65_00335 [Candidatus Gracilibacteria bacterium]|nr:hypothetical protein [Candidatus Gracilibacteria bacterium]
MIIKIYGNNEEAKKLLSITQESLDDLGLSEFIKAENVDGAEYAKELSITKDSAFCIEEETIGFKDVIFEGIVPEKAEITSLLMSIIGGEEDSGCSSGGCHGCGSSGSCGI